jgi:hypothetical protein
VGRIYGIQGGKIKIAVPPSTKRFKSGRMHNRATIEERKSKRDALAEPENRPRVIGNPSLRLDRNGVAYERSAIHKSPWLKFRLRLLPAVVDR